MFSAHIKKIYTFQWANAHTHYSNPMIKHKCHLYSSALCSIHPRQNYKNVLFIYLCIYVWYVVALKKHASIATKRPKKIEKEQYDTHGRSYCFQLSKMSHHIHFYFLVPVFNFHPLFFFFFTFSYYLTRQEYKYDDTFHASIYAWNEGIMIFGKAIQ